MADVRAVNRILAFSLCAAVAAVCLVGAGSSRADAAPGDAPQNLTPEQERNLAAQRDLSAWEDQDVGRLRRSAEQGDPTAQFELGFMYFTGTKLVQNFTQAV